MAGRKQKKRQPSETQAVNGELNWLTVVGAAQNNLRGIDVAIPLGRFVCVTGVSGSGKSSLVNDIIREALARDLNGAEKVSPGRHERIDGVEHLDKVIDIDQTPIGRTPRSNPATYIKVFDEIRSLYTKLPDAKVRGYKPGRFSFNVPSGPKGGGRCEACEGNGSNRMEMDFLADVWVTCPVCEGKRFSRETQQIVFKNQSIADVLNMDVQEALDHFGNVPKIERMLRTLHDVGLDYIKLGQSSTTLSGGEAQRIKLARELVKRSTGKTMYLLDEPTTGLHFDDIRRLLAVLHGFVDAGNTVLVIEHNLDVIKTADWVIDLGPEGGAGGGRIVAEGTPEKVAQSKRSYTGVALGAVLGNANGEWRMANGELKTAGTRHGKAGTGHGKAGTGHGKAGTGHGKAGTGHKAQGTRKARGGKSADSRDAIQNPQSAIRNCISVVGARQHNLQDVSVEVPRGKTTVCSGPSGSGKSSFALDTVYAEGQRRYVESLSSYARQFLGQIEKPKVDHVYGLSPAIAIEQKAASKSPRSTVGTVTEIYDYLRVLFARLGEPYCPKCQVPIGTQTADEIVDRLLELGDGTRLMLLAPVEPAAGESYRHLLTRERANGYSRARIDGAIAELNDDTEIDAKRRHTVELVVDRVIVRKGKRSRITDSVEQALAAGQGVMHALVVDAAAGESGNGATGKKRNTDAAPVNPQSAIRNPQSEHRFSQLFSCNHCGTSYDELTPHHFSFNSRMGWCDSCEGLGIQLGASPASIAVHPTRSLLDGAIAGWSTKEIEGSRGSLEMMIRALADHVGFDANKPWNQLAESDRMAVLQGCGDAWIDLKGVDEWEGMRFKWRGFFPAIDRATRVSWQYRKRLEEMVTEVPCEACGGSRLTPSARCARLFGRTMQEICRLPLGDALRFFKGQRLDRRAKRIAGELLHEIESRLQFLVDVGLDYLTLRRASATLSGGESQRIRLASQIGSGLTGVLYVLDEPTIGLHPRDNGLLIAALNKLRDLGNTLLMVEHDREVIESADHVLDFGPGAGVFGGQVVAEASPGKLARKRVSLTGRYLSGKESIAVPTNRRVVAFDGGNAVGRKTSARTDEAGVARGKSARTPPRRTRSVRGSLGPVPDRWLTVRGACEHNLKGIDVPIPLGRFVAVTGVSGSGKSTLINEVLYAVLAVRLHRARVVAGAHESIDGIELVDKVIRVDQAPIGNSPSSSPATYTGLFDVVRELYASLPEAKVRGYSINRFSFNRPGGRCEVCEGLGQRCIEMHFLPDVWVTCEGCGGRRYLSETLEVRYKGKSIADVLEMRVSEACEHFANVPKLKRMLQTLDDVGLGYVQLGQPAPTLSGGEAQRVKLATELGRPSTGKTIYLLDEPTTGLHFSDLRKLLAVLHRLVDLGNTVVCIEHNLDVIKTADWIIDLGPEAGESGGEIVIAGAPESVVAHAKSHTGKALAPMLAAGPHEERPVFDPDAQQVIEQELQRPVNLGDTVQMPWQRDGRRWHLAESVDQSGQRVQWQPQVLEWLVDTVEGIGGFEPTDWNNRARVEIKAAGSDTPWFLHARTRSTWNLDVTVRTAPRVFDEDALKRALKVSTLDERSDIPAYGQWSRVDIRRTGRGFDDVRIFLHDMKDVRKAALGAFLKKAAKAYFDMIASNRSDPAGAQPWKVDGRSWHLGRQAVAAGKQIRWTSELLLEIIGRIQKAVPNVQFNWSNKTAIMLHMPGKQCRVGRIDTRLPQWLNIVLRVPRGSLTPMMVDRVGRNPTFDQQGDDDQLTFQIRNDTDYDPKQLAVAVRCCADLGKRKEALAS